MCFGMLEALPGVYRHALCRTRSAPHDFVDDTPFVGCRCILLQTCMTLYVLYKTLSRRIIGRVFKERSGGLELPSKLRRTDSLGLALLVP